MRHLKTLVVGLILAGTVSSASALAANAAGDEGTSVPDRSASAHTTSEPRPSEPPSWLKAIPVPSDPELEAQLKELQDALYTIQQQIVRRQQLLDQPADPSAQTGFYQDITLLRKEHDKLESLLHSLIDEARASERTAIDDALARAKMIERQQESHQQREEAIRERRQ